MGPDIFPHFSPVKLTSFASEKTASNNSTKPAPGCLAIRSLDIRLPKTNGRHNYSPFFSSPIDVQNCIFFQDTVFSLRSFCERNLVKIPVSMLPIFLQGFEIPQQAPTSFTPFKPTISKSARWWLNCSKLQTMDSSNWIISRRIGI